MTSDKQFPAPPGSNPEKGPGPVPAKIGKYIVEKVIGRGAMGLVYLARDLTIDRPAALKTIHVPEGLSDVQVKEFRERFLREARAAGRLSHSAIVTVYEANDGSEGGYPFIAMEYVEGIPWNTKIRSGKPRDPEDILPMVRELASALDYAHKRGVIHRDVKPANVMETPDGHVKLMDFGIARVPTSELTQEGQCPGTPAYMSPEQVRGEKVDGRSDLFSLGAVLYELLTCRRAFTGDAITSITFQIVSKPTPLVREVVPSLSPEIDQVIQHLTAKDPAERYASARELMEDIDAYMAGASLPHAGTARAAAAAPPLHAEPPSVGPAVGATPTPAPQGQLASEAETVAGSIPPTKPAAAPATGSAVATVAQLPEEDAATVPVGEAALPISAPPQKPRRHPRPAWILGLGALLAALSVATAVAVWIAETGPWWTTAEPDLAMTNRLAAATADTYAHRAPSNAVTEPPLRSETAKPRPKPKPKPKPAEPPPAPVQAQPVVQPPPPPPPPPEPATVTFFFKTGIVKGEFWIKVDGKEAVHHVISRGASFASETYTGSFQAPAGTHTLGFEVRTEIQNVKGSHEEQVTFQAGQKRTLKIVMTKFNKELRFEWAQ